LEETVVRTLGELSGLGFDVLVRDDSTVSAAGMGAGASEDAALVQPRVHFMRGSAGLVIDAYCPDCVQSVRQVLRSGAPDYDPEIGAIRAVEALRATLLEYAQRTRQQAPKQLADYQKQEPHPVLPKALDAADSALEVTAKPATLGAARWRLGALAGAGVAYEPRASIWEGSWLFGVFAQRNRIGLELKATAPFSAQRFSRVEGSVDVSVFHAGGLLLWQLTEPDSDFRVSLGAGAGVAHFATTSTPNPGFQAENREHWTPYWEALLGFGYSVSGSFVLHLWTSLASVTSSPKLTVSGESFVSLGQPVISALLGPELSFEL
jgi:hypothetical protein